MSSPNERIERFLLKWHVSDHLYTSLIAILIGILGGYGAVLFRILIRAFQYVFYQNDADFLEIADQIPFYAKLLIPALAGAVVGPIVYFGAKETKGHGVPEVMEAMALRGGRIRSRVAVIKILASAITIGGGGSTGREGPIVQIGASVGSSVGQFLKVSQDRQRTFLGCGAAAGIAATFNAPIAGVFFALELLLGDFGVSTFAPIVIASVAATTISRYHFGNFPAFVVPPYELVSYWEYFFYGILGLLAGLVALLYILSVYKAEDLFDRMPIPDYTKGAVGGLILGSMLLVYPHLFGVGYGTIDLCLMNRLTIGLLFVLIFAKIAATSITLGCGMSGGVFAPALMIGALTGGFFGQVLNMVAPQITASSGAYALVAMGAVVAGATHAPIMSILILFEMTSDYHIILPLMLSCITSSLVASTLKKGSIFTTKLRRKGINLHMGRERGILRRMTVQDVMLEHTHMVPESMHLVDIIETFKRTNASYLQVVDQRRALAGIISFRDVRAVLQEEDLGHLIIARDVATTDVITVKRTESLEEALRKMGSKGISQLPVVDDLDPRKVVGVLQEKDLLSAYNREVFAQEMRQQ